MSRLRLAALYPIIDVSAQRPWARSRDLAQAVLAAGVPWLQLRCKALPAQRSVEIARELVELAKRCGAGVIVNDRVDVALASGAGGVHVGQEDLPPINARALLGPGRIVGVSTHTREEALRAQAAGADYVGFGPLFPTTTKGDALQPRPAGALSELRAVLAIPIVAIGGIDEQRAPFVLDAGADAVAMIGALAASADPRALAERLMRHRS